jgi:hypothetical protein
MVKTRWALWALVLLQVVVVATCAFLVLLWASVHVEVDTPMSGPAFLKRLALLGVPTLIAALLAKAASGYVLGRMLSSEQDRQWLARVWDSTKMGSRSDT